MLGVGKITGFVAEVRVQRLQMERYGIVDRASNFAIGEEFLERVAASRSNRVLVENMLVTGRNLRRADSGSVRQ